MNGGFDQRFFRAAKQGMKFNKSFNRVKNLNFNSKQLKENDFIEYKEWTPTIITDEINLYQQGGSLKNKDSKRSLEQLITYAKEQNPRFIQRMSEFLRYVKVNYKDKVKLKRELIKLKKLHKVSKVVKEIEVPKMLDISIYKEKRVC